MEDWALCDPFLPHFEKGQGRRVQTQPSRWILTHRRPWNFTAIVGVSHRGRDEKKRDAGQWAAFTRDKNWAGWGNRAWVWDLGAGKGILMPHLPVLAAPGLGQEGLLTQARPSASAQQRSALEGSV